MSMYLYVAMCLYVSMYLFCIHVFFNAECDDEYYIWMDTEHITIATVISWYSSSSSCRWVESPFNYIE